jgi:transposase
LTLTTEFFWEERGVLGLTLTRARSKCGSRVEDLKPFYRGAKVTVVGAISLKQVVGLMTINGSRDGQAFEVFIQNFLVPKLWNGAVVVMDNLPAHKLAVIEPLIQVAGATVLNLSPYSPDFNPIELWWSQVKAFLRQFSPTTTKMVDVLLGVGAGRSQYQALQKLVYKLLLYSINLEYAVRIRCSSKYRPDVFYCHS